MPILGLNFVKMKLSIILSNYNFFVLKAISKYANNNIGHKLFNCPYSSFHCTHCTYVLIPFLFTPVLYLKKKDVYRKL